MLVRCLVVWATFGNPERFAKEFGWLFLCLVVGRPLAKLNALPKSYTNPKSF